MTSKCTLLTLCASLLLGACASPMEMLGWAKDEPFVITAAEQREYQTAAPLFSKGIAQVLFIKGKVCLGCGDFSDTNGIGVSHIEGRLNHWFPQLLKQEIGASTLFAPSPRSLVVKSQLLAIDQHSSVGARAERASTMTSGAVLTTKVAVQYDLVDGGNVVGSWVVTTSARSNSLVASTRLTENIDGALKRNVRAFLLRLVADNSPSDSVRATQALASLQSEVDNKRIVLAYLVYGATKTVTTTAGVIGDGLLLVAQNSDVVAAELNKVPGQMRALDAASRGTSVEAEQAKARRDAAFYAQIAKQEADPNSDLNRDKRSRESAEAQRKADDKRRDDDRNAKREADRRMASARTDKSPSDSNRAVSAEPTRGQEEAAAAAAAAKAREAAARAKDEADAKAKALEEARLAKLKKDQEAAEAQARKAIADAAAAKQRRIDAWGPVQLEAVAICVQSKRSGKWACDGALDNQIIVDEPSLESALKRQHCAGGTWAAGGPVIDGTQWEAYRCGQALGAGDYDVARRRGLITARRSYMCKKGEPGDGRCTTIYAGQNLPERN